VPCCLAPMERTQDTEWSIVTAGSFTITDPGGSTLHQTFSHVIFGFNGVTGNFMDTGWTDSLPAALAAPATPTAGSTPGAGASTPTS
jgi:hypothetical protein